MTGCHLENPAPLHKLRRWLIEPHRVYGLWLGKHCVVAAWLGLFLALISPPHGLGLPLCWFQSATGVPCPGCGLTRSLSCGIRGLFLESWQYHPMGLVILALFVFTAVQSALPGIYCDRLGRFMQARAFFFNTLYLTFVTVFVSFGATRALVHWVSIWIATT
jgi:hypothetical protein